MDDADSEIRGAFVEILAGLGLGVFFVGLGPVWC